MNRLATCKNHFQGKHKRVLCVCSAGILRSPTAAFVLSNAPYNFNTRAAGVENEFALIPVDEVLVAWADEIVCMDEYHAKKVIELLPEGSDKRIVVLDIPDKYEYHSSELINEIKVKYDHAIEMEELLK
jgi:predicted protein tyrosine phosphatase